MLFLLQLRGRRLYQGDGSDTAREEGVRDDDQVLPDADALQFISESSS